MRVLAAQNSQFVIATHSPILTAYPDAWIYSLTGKNIERVAYTDTEHDLVTRSFLNKRGQTLAVLLKGWLRVGFGRPTPQ